MLIVPVKDNISTECEAGIMDGYLEVISLIERLHRQFLEVVKLELDGFGIRDINNVQAMMLFNIGDAEMTVGELILRGCYLGRVDGFDQDKRARKRDEGGKVLCGLLAA
jgi:hypothetical protein